MRNVVRRHWRVAIPIIIMVVIFCLSRPDIPTNHQTWPMVPLLLLLGASWYYYLRTLGKHTPGFTAFGSFLFVLFFAIFNEFCNPFTTDYKYAVQNILIYSAVGLVGIVIFAAVYYFSRTPKQRKARRKQVEEIWGRNARLVKRIRGKKN